MKKYKIKRDSDFDFVIDIKTDKDGYTCKIKNDDEILAKSAAVIRQMFAVNGIKRIVYFQCYNVVSLVFNIKSVDLALDNEAIKVEVVVGNKCSAKLKIKGKYAIQCQTRGSEMVLYLIDKHAKTIFAFGNVDFNAPHYNKPAELLLEEKPIETKKTLDT